MTRRQFQQLATGGFFWSGVLALSQPLGTNTYSQGIVMVSRSPARLRSPRQVPAGQTWRYGVGYPLQVGPRTAGLFCNLRMEYGPGQDFEVGTDLFLFESLGEIRASRAIPLSRNEQVTNPKSRPTGEPCVMVKYPIQPGFVPFGAKRTDGSPHPRAGTGFGIVNAIAWPLHDRYSQGSSAFGGRTPFSGNSRYATMEFQQYRFDGTGFQVTGKRTVTSTQLVPGWDLSGCGITSAIPDCDDLLLPMSGGKAEREQSAGVTRWRYSKEVWGPVSFVPVTGEDGSVEPSLIRDVDGALLFCCRGGGEPNYNDIRIWRSRDAGLTWTLIIHVRSPVGHGPISLNRAADGSPFVVANLNEVLLHPTAPQAKLAPRLDAKGRVRAGGWLREKLYLWPLNTERNGVELPSLVRDPRAEFGIPPGGTLWDCDHPIGATVRLRDDLWHGLVCFRLVEKGEVDRSFGPTDYTGCYVEEVFSSGPGLPAWHF